MEQSKIIDTLETYHGLEEYGDVVRELLEDGELVAGGNNHLVQPRVLVGVNSGHPPAGRQHRLETILGALPGV